MLRKRFNMQESRDYSAREDDLRREKPAMMSPLGFLLSLIISSSCPFLSPPGRVDEDVLPVPIAQPQHVPCHAPHGVGAGEVQPRLQPGHGLGELGQEPLVKARGHDAQNLGGERNGQGKAR